MNAFSVHINVEIHGPGDERVSVVGPKDENGLLLLRTLIAATAAVAKQLKSQPGKDESEKRNIPLAILKKIESCNN